MKKTFGILLCLTVIPGFLWLGAVHAEYVGPGASRDVTTVAEILKAPKDDMEVTLRGRIVKKASNEKYLFSDGSGEIRMDIDDDIFPVQEITDRTTVEINGEVEKEFLHSPEIDVDLIKVLKN